MDLISYSRYLLKAVLKWLPIGGCFFFVAYVVHAKATFFEFRTNFQHPDFPIVMLFSAFVLLCYALIISLVLRVYFERLQTLPFGQLHLRMWQVLLALMATGLIICINSLLLQIFRGSEQQDILFSSYWYTDFLYFIPFVIGYTLSIYRFPRLMIPSLKLGKGE